MGNWHTAKVMKLSCIKGFAPGDAAARYERTQAMTTRSKGWGRKLKLASVPMILAGLAACATPFQADVSRFQTQLPLRRVKPLR